MTKPETIIQDVHTKNGKDRPTVSAIAESVGVSPSTVSFVLSGQAKKRRVSDTTARKIAEAAKKVGYVPNIWAQNLRRQRSGVISLLLGNLYFSWAQYTVLGVEEALDKHGYNYFIGIHHWEHSREAKEFDLSLQRKDEGAICQPVLESRETYLNYMQNDIPLVLLDILPNMPDMNYVTWDCGPAARAVMEHLIRIGRKRICFIGSRHLTMTTTARFQAYQQTMAESGLETPPEWILWDFTRHGRVEQTDLNYFKRLFSGEQKPDAMFCLNDAIAVRVIDFLKKLDIKVPDDVAVAGMGNLPLSEDYAVGLTTVREPIFELGKIAAEVLVELIKHPEKKPVQRLVPCVELKVRRTTAG